MTSIDEARQSVPNVDWIWPVRDWQNDRVITGPFTTRTLDKQSDIVTLENRDRLQYIYKFGRLIYEHHADPNEPVTVLGDCIGVGVSPDGSAYGMWGVYDGTETVDEKWAEMKEYNKTAGFSIGGKIPDGARKCFGDHCQLSDPEILEVSWTKSPANTDCKVYYTNQVAKNLIQKSSQNHDMLGFHFDRAVKKVNKVFTTRFQLDDYYDIHSLEDTHPCIKEYLNGAMELGIKRPNAEQMLDDLLVSIKKKVSSMKEPKVQKENYTAPPQAPPQPEQSPNAAMEKLDFLITEIGLLKQVLQSAGLMQSAEPEPEMDGQEGEAPPAEAPTEEKAVEEESEPSSEDTEPGDDEKKKAVKSDIAEDKGNPAGGDGEAPNPDIKPEPPETDAIEDDQGNPTGQTEEAGYDMGDDPEEKGNISDEDKDVLEADGTEEGTESTEMGEETGGENTDVKKSYWGKIIRIQSSGTLEKAQFDRLIKGKVDTRPGVEDENSATKETAPYKGVNDPMKKSDDKKNVKKSRLSILKDVLTFVK